MSEYQPPLNDMLFTLEHVADLPGLAKLARFEEAEPAFVEQLLREAGRFVTEVLSPLDRIGDREGARLEDGQVRTPSGFADAYRRFAEAGWGAVAHDPAHGGAGLPYVVSLVVQEMVAAANMAFGLCPSLGDAAIEALGDHGSPELKRLFLRKLVSGEWTATMDLTEAHAGSDLGMLRTSAEPRGDGSYGLKGTKIFITYGDHDWAENVVHLVLARTPDAPAGSRGISCFVVPKRLVAEDGSLAGRNDISIVSLEHKLGIHASPTCVVSYGERGGAIGYLIGEENQGLRYMFTMMNRERMFVGIQGLGVAERAYQRALEYARERTQGRAPGRERPSGEPSPIIDHPDVRRMLLGMKARIEAMRALAYDAAATLDRAAHDPDPQLREAAAGRGALLTPVVKAWLTDTGVEVTSLGVQVHGGTGYVEETGAAQQYRDARITPIYEGTNGIQAFDLVMRKLPQAGGEVVRSYLDELRGIAAELGREAGGESLGALVERLGEGVEVLAEATDWVLSAEDASGRARAAGATPYLRLFGTVAGAFGLARGALVALRGSGEDPFLRSRLVYARFFAEQLLPPVLGELAAVRSGSELLDSWSPAE